MAWFDILAGVGQGLGQSAQDWQRQLLLKRERADQQKREEEERRRFNLSEARANRAEQRLAEADRRAVTSENREAARTLLSSYEPGTTVSDEEVKAIAELDSAVAKGAFTKQPDGTYMVRDTTAAKAARQRLEAGGYEIKALQNKDQATTTVNKILDNPELANKYSDRALATLAVTAGYPEEILIPVERRSGYLLQQQQFRFQADEGQKQRAFQAGENRQDRLARSADAAAARAADDAMKAQEFNLRRAAEYRQYFKDWFAQTYENDPDIYQLNPDQERIDREHVRALFAQEYPGTAAPPPLVSFTPSRTPTLTTPKNSIGQVLKGGRQ